MLSGSLIPLDSVADGVVDAVTSAGENSSTVLLNAFATKTSPAASVATLTGPSIPLDSVRRRVPALENSSTVPLLPKPPTFATKTSPAASVATLSGKSPVDSVRTGTTPAVENSSTVLFP
jgi:hypothetical protein